MRNGYFSGRGWFFLVAAACSLLACFSCPAVADVLDQDFEFASGLVDIGFADYADKVVQQVLRLHPDQKDRAKLIQAEILISRRKFTEAEEMVKAMGAGNPKAQAISLALAKGYYVLGETDKAKQLYNDFFKQYEGRVPTDPDLLRFYQDSAYQFGQMLEMAGDKEGAIKAYSRVLATNPDRNVGRRHQAEQAELYVKLAAAGPMDQREKNLGEAKKLCETIQWGGMDISFGQSIITMAHIAMVRGDRGAAQKVLRSNMDILKEIDEYIQEQGLPLSVSPMAGARFLLGELLQKDAEALAKQKKTDEAVQAYGKALDRVLQRVCQVRRQRLGPAGRRARPADEDPPGNAVRQEGEHRSRSLPDQGRRGAVPAGRQPLPPEEVPGGDRGIPEEPEQFPETDASVTALGNLLLSYANLDDKLMVKMVTAYLGERFAGKDAAALALLAAGQALLRPQGRADVHAGVRDLPEVLPEASARGRNPLHAGRPPHARRTTDAGATKYYQRIVDDYPKDQYYTKALNQLAWGYFAASNYAGAVKGFTNFIREAQPSPDKAQAQFALADCYRQTGEAQGGAGGVREVGPVACAQGQSLRAHRRPMCRRTSSCWKRRRFSAATASRASRTAGSRGGLPREGHQGVRPVHRAVPPVQAGAQGPERKGHDAAGARAVRRRGEDVRRPGREVSRSRRRARARCSRWSAAPWRSSSTTRRSRRSRR